MSRSSMATTPSSPLDDAASLTKKPQPIPWTHQETVHLIRAYQEKWYSLKRGPLRKSQWEEVAVIVAARCGHHFNHPSKSALQCRHKMEKLRQRHRAEKKHHLPRSTWQYSSLMDDLEQGPLPIAALAPVQIKYNENNEDNDDNDDDCDDDVMYENERENYIKSRSINYILSQMPVRTKDRGFPRERVFEDYDLCDDDDDNDDYGGGDGDGDDVLGLSAEMRAFAERFIGMESLKMEMMKETERCRLEMEKKRIQMILDSQQRIVDSIGRVFGTSKRMKFNQQI
ncbi:hypothetical protein RJT34_22078 [Clitoria ternatea]|uniref:Myb-like domain-containing protein n=1 Tax=Clitoria ternatea TaxID=43366 RepID=A0AAN9IUW8_CLITE